MNYKIGSIYTDITLLYKRYVIILRIQEATIVYYFMDMRSDSNKSYTDIYNSNKGLFNRMIDSWKMEG